MSGPEPFVAHLVLEPEPHLVAQECGGCQARYVAPRAACPGCGSRSFTSVDLPTEGTVRTWSVVRRAPYDALVPAPYVPAVVELSDGTAISATIVGVEPELVVSGLPVQLVPVEHDKGVAFGFTSKGA